MMIVVPGFAHGHERERWKIVSLYGVVLQVPISLAIVVSQISDEPMSDQRNCDPHRDAPDREAPTSDQIK